jgi:hypothetical protein
MSDDEGLNEEKGGGGVEGIGTCGAIEETC